MQNQKHHKKCTVRYKKKLFQNVTSETAPLLVATDPDCDRVGVAVRNGSDYSLLSGNEVGMLLLRYIAERRGETHTMPFHPVVVKTIVTIDMATRIAADYGIEVRDVLTGFKFIGEQIGLLEKQGEEDRYILGFEESCGYLTGSYVRDKDAVDGVLMISDMFVYYRSKGFSLLDILDDIYSRYGYCLNTLHSYGFDGKQGFEKMRSIMDLFRNSTPVSFFGKKIVSVGDYLLGVVRTSDGKELLTRLPPSDVLKFMLEDNISFVVSPSGTEPKLKLYLSVSAPDKAQASSFEAKLISELEKLMGV